MKKALITGVTGQDGAYLSEFLFKKGYEVHGIVRSSSTDNLTRLKIIFEGNLDRLMLHYGDIKDASRVQSIVSEVKPDEVYSLAALTDVHASYHEPAHAALTNGLGVLNVLEGVRNAGLSTATRIFQASTSELYGETEEVRQNESTIFCPRSPYSIAKQYAFSMTTMYREAYGMYIANGILFNHESPLRSERFVTRKITRGACRIKLGLQENISLGNLNSKRDWGYAKEYVQGMWLMLQQEKPEDFVLATGQSHSVREFAQRAFNELDIPIEWKGEGADEVGVDRNTGKIVIKVDQKMMRRTEVPYLFGDATKAKRILGWEAEVKLPELVKMLIVDDFKKLLTEQ